MTRRQLAQETGMSQALAAPDLHDAADELAVLRELETWLFRKCAEANERTRTALSLYTEGERAYWSEEWRNYWRLHQRVQASIAAMEGR